MRANQKLDLSLAVSAVACLYVGCPLPISLGVAVILVLFKSATSERLAAALKVLIVLYPLYITLVQYQQWWAGDQGLDFGIFAQLISQVAASGRFTSSLISTEWQNFFTHHFSPYLIVLGGIARLGAAPEIVLIGAHGLAAAFLISGVATIASDLLRSSKKGLLIAALVILTPSLRKGMIWETHDEVLALPFLIWSAVAFIRGQTSRSLWLLLPTLLFKETAGIVIASTSIGYFVNLKSRRAMVAAFGVFGVISAVLLIRVFPHRLWIPTFNPASRLGTLEQLLSLDLIRSKLIWLALVALPAISFLPLISVEYVGIAGLFLAPIFYNLTAISLTAYEPMLNYGNYYAITPVVFILLAVTSAARNHKWFTHAVVISLVILCVSPPAVRLSRDMGRVFSAASAQAELLQVIDRRAVVIVDDHSASVLFDTRNPVRVYHARKMRMDFDYIVSNKRHGEELPEALRSRAYRCHESLRYVVWCRAQRS